MARSPRIFCCGSNAENKRQRKAVGVCVSCSNPAKPNRNHCIACGRRNSTLALQKQRDRIKAGVCPQCGLPVAKFRLCDACNGKQKTYNNSRNRQLKKEAMEAYGNGKCQCCGESHLAFLTIDHKNNDGAAHRKKRGAFLGANFYGWLKANNWPTGFRCLCWNCNSGRDKNGGICPHIENSKMRPSVIFRPGRLIRMPLEVPNS